MQLWLTNSLSRLPSNSVFQPDLIRVGDMHTLILYASWEFNRSKIFTGGRSLHPVTTATAVALIVVIARDHDKSPSRSNTKSLGISKPPTNTNPTSEGRIVTAVAPALVMHASERLKCSKGENQFPTLRSSETTIPTQSSILCEAVCNAKFTF